MSLFRPYRALGIYSGNYPGIVHFHKNRRYHILQVPIQNCFHSYKVDGLGIIGISDSMPGEITQLSEYHSLVSGQAEEHVWIFFNGKVQFRHKSAHRIVAHFLFDMNVVVLLTEQPCITVVDFRDGEILCEIPLVPDRVYAHLLHPPTYENKVLVTNDLGEIEMYNIKTAKRIYSFDVMAKRIITTIIPTPHLHVIGVGTDDGTFALVSLKTNEVILKLNQACGVTAVDCRTDVPLVAVGTSDGKVSVWDLEHMQLVDQISAHDSAVLSVSYLPKEDCFVSVGCDNALRVFAEGKKLRERFGHSLPPAHIQFYGGEENHVIISAGLDQTLKMFSPEHESGNRNLGKATLFHKSKKSEHQLSAITKFATSSNREAAWDNLVAIHHNGTRATTWSTKSLKRGQHWLSAANDGVNITSVECSQCGNMVWLGRDDGSLHEFNLQSGKLRKTFKMGDDTQAHDGTITGIGCQMLQIALITVSADRTLKVWRIKSGKYLEKLTLDEPIQRLTFQRTTNLAAVALANFSIIIIDCTEHPLTLSRTISGHSAEITAMSWSSDTRWLATAAMSGIVKVWDIATAQLIDQFKTPSIPTSLDFSPHDQFLATAHVDELGVFLWSNINSYNPRPLKPIDINSAAPAVSMLPRVKIEDTLAEVDMEQEEAGEICEYESPNRIDDYLTVSGMPNSRWISLVNLKLIKLRNKVVDVKVPVKAPFFLPSVAGLEPTFDRTALEEEPSSKLTTNTTPLISLVTDIGRQMEAYLESTDQMVTVMNMMKEFSPSKLDSEISALDPEGCCSMKPLNGLLSLLRDCLKSGVFWDGAQAMLRVALSKHFEQISDNDELMETVQECKLGTRV